MDTLIEKTVAETVSHAKGELSIDLSDDQAFSYVIIDNYFFNGELDHLGDIQTMVTDGKNDGGIDFVCYDEDRPSVIVGQSKYRGSVDYNTIAAEFEKMRGSVYAFRNGNASSLNMDVQRELQECFDTLPDDASGSVEYYFVTTADVNVDRVMKKLSQKIEGFDRDQFVIQQGSDIATAISQHLEQIDVIPEDYIEIDDAKNYLEYEAPNKRKGVFVNVSSESISRLYRKYIDHGLLALNIRGFVKNTSIDTGIRKSLNKDREDFWFYNNGVTIACRDYRLDGDRVKLYDFSIVNGGQTTTLIGKYDGSNTSEFFFPCKIVSPAENEDASEFYTQIAEATNSQKPIRSRDLRSNSGEMKRLQSWLAKEGVFLQIKRGDNRGKGNRYVLNNEVWAQLMLSFVYQKPGTARSNKKKIWESTETYNRLFKQSYERDSDKQAFILDLIDLYKRFSETDKYLKSGDSPLSGEEKEALKNGKMAIFAQFGLLYDLVNKDIEPTDLSRDISQLDTLEFRYGSFLRHYRGDDVDELINQLTWDMTNNIYEVYNSRQSQGVVSSVSNLLKTDKRYRDDLVPYFLRMLLNGRLGEQTFDCAKRLFLREENR